VDLIGKLPGLAEAAELKWYVYRSASKIDMLFDQIDSRYRARYSADLKVKLVFAEAGGRVESREGNLQTKLALVLRHLEAAGRIGAPGSGAPFMRGVMPMTWQEVDFWGGKPPFRMVLFSGHAGKPNREEVVVGLIGSAANVTGMNDLEPATVAYSQPAFWGRVIEELSAPSEDELEEHICDLNGTIDYQGRRREDGPPKQVLEFVAKVLLSRPPFVVGTPIYVAEHH
jgi:hypothetical protein